MSKAKWTAEHMAQIAAEGEKLRSRFGEPTFAASPPHTEAPAAQDEREAWEQWVSARADMLRTGHNERIFRAGYAAALAARAPQAAAEGQAPLDRHVLAPNFRGYANLGTGEYLINHSVSWGPAELVISIATEADKAGRAVGEDRPNPLGGAIQPETMAVRLRFQNEAGLDALEKQLRHVRRVHFPGSCAAPPAQAAPAPQPEAATIRNSRTVDPTERSDQSIQRAAGGGAVQPVAWECRAFYGDDTADPGWGDWGDWERVTPRNAHMDTVADRVREIQGYIARGHRYELRALYATPPVESVERDAARFAWFVENVVTGSIGFGDWWIDAQECKDSLRAAIDAALAGHKEQQP